MGDNMTKLLSADFFRMFRSRPFKVAVIIMLVLDIYDTIDVVLSNDKDFTDDLLISMVFGLLIILPPILSLFLGNDYKNGTFRNKIICGHSKTAIYLSNLIVTSTTALMLWVGHIIIVTIGVQFIGGYNNKIEDIVLLCVIATFAILTLIALFTFFSVLFDSKSDMVAGSIITPVAMFFFAIIVQVTLEQTDVTDFWHKLFYFLDNALPLNQIMYVIFWDIENCQPIMIAYSAMLIFVLSALGIVIFRKKNLK